MYSYYILILLPLSVRTYTIDFLFCAVSHFHKKINAVLVLIKGNDVSLFFQFWIEKIAETTQFKHTISNMFDTFLLINLEGNLTKFIEKGLEIRKSKMRDKSIFFSRSTYSRISQAQQCCQISTCYLQY